MGKMKEKFTEEQERLVNEAVEAFMDEDYQYQEYLNTLAESMGYSKPKPVTMEETQAQHDAWWNSLTEEQKQQLYNDQEELFKLTIEEINYKDE
tara:strand:- start:413 stop:694 length:282 start_codon:yes stop_codon:yes gene_type:complete